MIEDRQTDSQEIIQTDRQSEDKTHRQSGDKIYIARLESAKDKGKRGSLDFKKILIKKSSRFRLM